MNFLFLILALIFAGLILIIGYIENYKKRGYNMPFDEDHEFAKREVERMWRERKHQVRTPWKT